MVLKTDLENQKHIKFIIQILGSNKRLRRNELFKKFKILKKKFMVKDHFIRQLIEIFKDL